MPFWDAIESGWRDNFISSFENLKSAGETLGLFLKEENKYLAIIEKTGIFKPPFFKLGKDVQLTILNFFFNEVFPQKQISKGYYLEILNKLILKTKGTILKDLTIHRGTIDEGKIRENLTLNLGDTIIFKGARYSFYAKREKDVNLRDAQSGIEFNAKPSIKTIGLESVELEKRYEFSFGNKSLKDYCNDYKVPLCLSKSLVSVQGISGKSIFFGDIKLYSALKKLEMHKLASYKVINPVLEKIKNEKTYILSIEEVRESE